MAKTDNIKEAPKAKAKSQQPDEWQQALAAVEWKMERRLNSYEEFMKKMVQEIVNSQRK